MAGEDVGIKENLPPYHVAMAQIISNVFPLLMDKKNEDAKRLMAFIVLYGAATCGAKTKKLEELINSEPSDLLVEMARMNQKAGFAPIQHTRTELLYDKIYEFYMDPDNRRRFNASSPKQGDIDGRGKQVRNAEQL
jgi:hypothetical protein